MRPTSFATLALATALIVPGLVHAAVRESLSDERIALRVDDWAVSVSALRVLHQVTAAQEPTATLAQVVSAVVQDHVIGAYALRQHGDARLFEAARVAFSPQASVDASLISTLHSVYREPLAAALAPDGGARFIVKRHRLAPDRLAVLLNAGAKVRLDDRLDAASEAALKEVLLVDYRFDGAPLRHVTLHDVWQQLNVQGRNALYKLDTEFANRQALQIVQERFVRHWVQTKGGLSADELARLQQVIANRERRTALARLLGVSADPHYVSPEITHLKEGIGREEIARYYSEHKDEFQRTERVLARHIRCPDEACANAASAELAQGVSFSEVARRYSQAASRAKGGALGWLDAKQTGSDWLNQLAFAQPPGPPTRPVREPMDANGQAGWQIVQVEKRSIGSHEPDSETVRFAASEAIARQRAVARFAALRNRLVDASDIELNRTLLGFGASALRLKDDQ